MKGYLDDLTQTYMIRQLQPWHENLNKRQVKSPKLTRSMRIAMEDLKLDELTIICPGDVAAQLDNKISVEGLESLINVSNI